MAGAYSSTYSKLQAQGQLLHPSMQLEDADMNALEADALMTGAALLLLLLRLVYGNANETFSQGAHVGDAASPF